MKRKGHVGSCSAFERAEVPGYVFLYIPPETYD